MGLSLSVYPSYPGDVISFSINNNNNGSIELHSVKICKAGLFLVCSCVAMIKLQ